jgi:hypothetical protein
MYYAMDGSDFIILGETPCTDLHAESSWSNGIGCPLIHGMLSFGNMERVTSMGPDCVKTLEMRQVRKFGVSKCIGGSVIVAYTAI